MIMWCLRQWAHCDAARWLVLRQTHTSSISACKCWLRQWAHCDAARWLVLRQTHTSSISACMCWLTSPADFGVRSPTLSLRSWFAVCFGFCRAALLRSRFDVLSLFLVGLLLFVWFCLLFLMLECLECSAPNWVFAYAVFAAAAWCFNQMAWRSVVRSHPLPRGWRWGL